MTDIGTRLRDERIRLGLSQTEFGTYGGVRKNTQSKYESNERAPDALYLANVAKHGVDVQYVITGVKKAEADDDVSQLLAGWTSLADSQKKLILDLLSELTK
ncbi:helix-turn-helix domain-containing protein [Shewanella xiamenensis]|uniref:helix-turn-helix domain-containing protein n=1 Tax=Shewanella xiamenensis TaxID=332186 RepID=UPI001F06AEED|nr:helix-turn-helix transcriptional regulator [Shewanella xiamenensis]UML92126.1 helix-turn-helix domain-containing protein [Shewanella xiamenensis]